MDVSKQKNVERAAFIPPIHNLKTDDPQQSNDYTTIQLSDSQTNKRNNTQHNRMRERITYILLFLFIFIVVYGLIMQNYWLVGVTCVPVIVKGISKIYDRYL